ncbi:hypothetical protein AB0J80_33720 [Actinoplanes sp. NPDC049548]|uniref:hypothetical protein n=1 Tax=Actinoplanes sp. NPDC049548 TaxID=3155152 RepID=UPI003448C13B
MADNTANHRRLVIAAVLAGTAGLALVALGWWVVGWRIRADWGSWADGSWWAGAAVRGLGYLAFGKAGFKVALILLAGVSAGTTWVRARRRKPTDAASVVDESPPDDNSKARA